MPPDYDSNEEEYEEGEEEDVPDDEEEDYDMRMFGISRALPVSDAPSQWQGDGPPEAFDSAEEYLQWVRYEASKCPQTHRVEVEVDAQRGGQVVGGAPQVAPSSALGPLSRLMKGRDVPSSPPWSHPKRDWVRAFVVEFKALRVKISGMSAAAQGDRSSLASLPHVNNKKEWERLCFGPSGDNCKEGPTSTSLAGGSSQQEPRLTTLLSMDQVSVVSTLTWLIEVVGNISDNRARWIFALSAALEKPVHAETAALFRSLFRQCCGQRADLIGPSDPSLPILNMLIVISGGYFGQDESIGSMVKGLEDDLG